MVSNAESMLRPVLIITCEHGGNKIPAAYRHLFANADFALNSHRGYDIGALDIARQLADEHDCELFFSQTSRLLIDLNRSLDHRAVYSEWTRKLDPQVQLEIVARYYQPYRTNVIAAIQSEIVDRPVLHISVHSFTPVLEEKVRKTDLGLLFDPRRSWESKICREWQRELQVALPAFAIHRNLPYRGTSDGFTTFLRTKFPEDRYAGIEIEINQKFFEVGNRPDSQIPHVLKALSACVGTVKCE